MWSQVRALLLRSVYRPLWPVLCGPFARSQLPLTWDEGVLARAGFPHQVSCYSCPIINPPAQRHVLENKLYNLGLAISRMQGLVLQPREIFSFWGRVGCPDAARGFREAATLVNRRLTLTVGGGLCQLSGMLYNVALLAGCRILQRYPHSVDAYGEGRYLPLGRDATVDYPKKDLCFQNPHRYPLVLLLDMTPVNTSGALYAPRARDFSVEIIVSPAEVLPAPVRQVLDPSLPAGWRETEPGLDGKRTTAWRVVNTHHGRSVRECLSRDIYAATPTVVRVGTGVPGEGHGMEVSEGAPPTENSPAL